jgi:glycosyltransferase involved in cell wall biosynthesis
MRIALLQPTYWPEVRRGSERLVHDLAVTLEKRGHDVTLLTSHRAGPTVAREEGVRVVRRWRPPECPPLTTYEHHVANIPGVVWELLRGDYEVAHAFFGPDAWAALKARRWGGPSVIFSFHGIPNRRYLVRRRYRLELIETAARESADVSVLSGAAVDPFRRYFAREPLVLPGGVFCDAFAADVARNEAPTFICAASLGDPRKRAGLLFEAFAMVRARRPGARLLVVRTPDPVMSSTLESLPEGVDWVDGDRTEDLARAYATAWASVLPAVEEAFGLVLIESLCAGTPVVAARSGACPRIVTDERIGRLFAPDDPESLAAAMLAALELGAREGTAEACRSAASSWDWSRVVERYEGVYDQVRTMGASRPIPAHDGPASAAHQTD